MRIIRLACVTFALGILTTGANADPSVRVYSSGPTLPVNVLRFSIRFPTAHAPGVVERLSLRYVGGADAGRPFLDQELWTPDDRTVTMLFDPGRVKTGTVAHEKYGYALQRGKMVSLLLGGVVLHSWLVAVEQRVAPNPHGWTILAPAGGSTSPLIVRLHRPIDIMGEGSIVPVGPGDAAVPGSARLINEETTWEFLPAAPWAGGRYRLIVDPHLEDAEGNAISNPLERRINCNIAHARPLRPITLPFKIRRNAAS